MRTFELTDGKSNKFWSIERAGTTLTVRFGKIGSAGQTQQKEFADEAKALKEHDKLVAEKTGKGYVEVTAGAKPAAAPASLRDALIAAVVEAPDDLASHMALADHLGEVGDPWGEFIRVQLALEDPGRSPADRKALQKQEKALLRKHQATWLGPLATLLLEADDGEEPVSTTFTTARGWVDSLKVERYTVQFMRDLARCPQLRLLRRLELANQRYEEEGEWEAGPDAPADVFYPQLHPLARSPYLGNVRYLQVGELLSPEEEEDADDGGISCHTEGEAAAGLVQHMPKLEELHLLCHDVDAARIFSLPTLTRLRVLRLYHNHKYPLARLAKNPALRNLTHLLLHPHAAEDDRAYIRLADVKAVVRSENLPALTHLQLRMTDAGDKGIKEIVESGILRRLRRLDLTYGVVSDLGAGLLADCPDARNLEALVLTGNTLTDAGIARLEAAGLEIEARRQWRPSGNEYSDMEYLNAGDIE